MSGVLVAVGVPFGDPGLERAWARVRDFGGEAAELRVAAHGVAGVARRDWQRRPDLAGGSLVVADGDVVVAADATLYDRDGLARALRARGHEPRGPDPGHWIAAAWRAWGDDLVEHLVGDYAFALLDGGRRRLLAARDPMGGRPLFHARRGDALAVGSSSRGLALWRGTPDDLDVATLGAQVAGTLLAMGTSTVYTGVEALRPGFVLTHGEDGVRTRRFWTPPSEPDPNPQPLDEAAEAFRDLLSTAVDDRMGRGTTTVWMSGGWDSTAVFGTGRARLAGAPDDERRLRPVSIRYPADDPGFEDPWIEATGRRWEAPIEWIDSGEIPLLVGLARRAAEADEPPAHMYELWNVALARGTRRLGSHVALDGCGGDNLFQVSDVVMADALRRGRLAAAARLARARRPLGWRYLVRHALVPLAPEGLLRAVERATGRNVPRHHMELARTPWVPEAFVRRHGLRERDLAILGELPASSHAQGENVLYVTVPALAWGGAYMRGVLLREGVEARSPLLDRRVIEFALRRPVSDRVAEAETKLLLRRAVRGWVPDEVLAPRPHRTGVTSGYSARRFREELPMLLDAALAAPLRTAELGIVDPAGFRRAVDAWRAGRGDHLRSELFATLRVEFWLRGRDHA